MKAIASLLFLGWSLTATAGQSDTPPNLPGVTVVSAEQARALMFKGTLIVDARVAGEYVEERIKGAINIPYKETPDQVVELRVMVYVNVEFSPDGRVRVLLSEPSEPLSGRQWADTKEKVLLKSRGFGPAGMRALKKADERFKYWQKKFV